MGMRAFIPNRIFSITSEAMLSTFVDSKRNCQDQGDPASVMELDVEGTQCDDGEPCRMFEFHINKIQIESRKVNQRKQKDSPKVNL